MAENDPIANLAGKVDLLISQSTLIQQSHAALSGQLQRVTDQIDSQSREHSQVWQTHRDNLDRLEKALEKESVERKAADDRVASEADKSITSLRATLSRIALTLLTFALGLVASGILYVVTRK